MREVQFLCLAVSRRNGGNCIAGIDIDSGKWIRPVHATTHEALGDCEIVVRDGNTQKLRVMALLDILQLNIDKYVGHNCQPENWTLAPASHGGEYTVLRRFDGPRDAEKLAAYLDQHGPLLHSHSDKIQEAEVKARLLTHSLVLIRPEELHWRVSPKSNYPAELQVRADFLFDRERYSLVLTDPVWEARCRRLGQGRYTHSTVAGDARGEVLLTISLAGAPLYGFHYKLVAGVVCLAA